MEEANGKDSTACVCKKLPQSLNPEKEQQEAIWKENRTKRKGTLPFTERAHRAHLSKAEKTIAQLLEKRKKKKPSKCVLWLGEHQNNVDKKHLHE
mmetsp:Transcript_12031/g.15983  ORF Transcript_12031/g.15983 Transcript_12031/m.15983 type:complete len:95 (+) Transcript_12031:43-327(+)